MIKKKLIPELRWTSFKENKNAYVMLTLLAFRFEKFFILSAGIVLQTVHSYNGYGGFKLYSLFSILYFVTRL